MKIGLISPASGIPTTYPFNGYGGIERIVADLAHAFRDMGHYVLLVGYNGSDAGTDNFGIADEIATELMYPMDVDVVLDFSHSKRYSGPKYSIPFWSDEIGDNPIFPTYAVQWAVNGRGDVIYPGIDLSRYHMNPGHDADHYVYVGRITPYKGIEMINYLIANKGYNIKLYGHVGKFGDDKYADREDAYLKSIGHEGIHKNPSEAEKIDALSNSKGLVFAPNWSYLNYNIPNPVESFGITAVEALACGVPVFTNNRISGVREIISENRYGGVFDINEWHQMGAFYRDPESLYARAQFFSAKSYANRLLEYIRDRNDEA